MRKIGVLLIAVMLIICLSGCNEDDVYTSELEGNITELTEKLDELESTDNDPLFWTSATRSVDMVCQALEKNVGVEVDYRLQIDKDTEIIDGFGAVLEEDNDTCRSLVNKELLFALATNDKVEEAHRTGKSVEVTGVIIRWKQRKNWFSQDTIDFSACELDSTGNWDYACRGKLRFFGMPHVISVEYEVEGVELGMLSPAEDATTLSALRSRAFR